MATATTTTKPASIHPPPTVWETALSTQEKLDQGWRYVEVPERDPIFSKRKFPVIRINTLGLLPGQKYLLPKPLAETAEDRIATYTKGQMRLLQADQDESALTARNSQEAATTRDWNPLSEAFAVA